MVGALIAVASAAGPAKLNQSYNGAVDTAYERAELLAARESLEDVIRRAVFLRPPADERCLLRPCDPSWPPGVTTSV